MTLSLKCTCGVRLDIPENFAGQQITCPDCQHPIAVPRSDPALTKTSGLALTSLLLALAGAFTIIGTVLAVVFGILALVFLRRQQEEVTGQRYAITGIVLGVVLTAATVFAYSAAGRLGLRNLMGRAQWAGKLDFGGPLTVKGDEDKFSITRPSERWGVLKTPKQGEQHIVDELLLVNVEEDAHILVLPERFPGDQILDQYLAKVKERLKTEDLGKIFGGKSVGDVRIQEVTGTKRPPAVGPLTLVETVIDKRMAGQERTFIVRVVQKENDVMVYLILAGARKRNFDRVEPQLRQALDSFKVTEGDLP